MLLVAFDDDDATARGDDGANDMRRVNDGVTPLLSSILSSYC